MTKSNKIVIKSLYLFEINVFTSFKLILTIYKFCLYLIIEANS